LAVTLAWTVGHYGSQTAVWLTRQIAAGMTAPGGLAYAANVPPADVVIDDSWLTVDGAWESGERYARVTGTGPSGLRVRTGPGSGHRATIVLREESVVRIVASTVDNRGEKWFRVAGQDGDRVSGWSSTAYLTPLEPDEPVTDREPGAPSIILGRILPVVLTAYTYQVPGNGAHGWITRSGDPAEPGVVAVDPRVIPLGTKLAIEGDERLFVAKDTGFGVLGHHVDVFYPDWWTAVSFGVQYRDIIVYE
jgi:3D (Asp-Asp-Asp) domain-containing protein